MPSSSIDLERTLARWLRRLVAICRTEHGDTWKAIVRAASGRRAIIRLDECRLSLRASGGSSLRLHIHPVKPGRPENFCTGADTLRDIIAGRLTLDAAISRGELFVRGSLRELLQVHALVMRLLGDGPLNVELRRLWAEFDETWPTAGAPPCTGLSEQSPIYGAMIGAIPEAVLRVALPGPRRGRDRGGPRPGFSAPV